MPTDQLTDEALVESYHGGSETAFETLYYRYFKPVRHYLPKCSFFNKDIEYLEELVQLVFVAIFNAIRDGKFVDRTEGSFKKYVFAICRLEAIKQDQKRLHQPKVISQLVPAADGREDRDALPDDIIFFSWDTFRALQCRFYLTCGLSFLINKA